MIDDSVQSQGVDEDQVTLADSTVRQDGESPAALPPGHGTC